ncbi:MAG: hypothetical protein QF876_02965 [Desulfobacterales bacterium]|jgi:hypothetical protein|nr:hypothetical protein [Desulfobacter sp.]MDP6681941.1 hypothetical protein [Desulfobacterales bacterium]MDP6808350.1 hypothetical protein [Desulfobacterales bacterium]|tara:strand:+ start:5758 stop:6297 length:540 start_codon:yes stop_codon:yes gene_type:complete
MKRLKKIFPIVFLITFVLLPAGIAKATTILEVSFAEVIQGAELIFEGRVLSEETRPSPIDGRPFTYFTFEIIDVINGPYSGNYIELGFAGGTLRGLTLSVSNMRMPEIGERGVYFVESLTQELVHPLYGWHQGHYLVVTDPANLQEKVVPLLTNLNVLATAQTVDEFKQNVRDIMGGGR